jgi:DHA1 family multidrug resistance protein-like MFS transporter
MKKTLIIVFIIYLFQGIIHNLGHPITPDMVKTLGIQDLWFGVFFALMSLGLALGGLFWGILGDTYNKKTLILIGLIIYSIGQYVFGNVHILPIMVIARFISGFAVASLLTLLLSYLIEKSEPMHKTRNIAFGAAILALGASVGYMIGGRLPDLLAFFDVENIVSQAEIIFLIQAVLNVVLALSIYLSLDDCHFDVSKTQPTMLEGIKSIGKLNVNLIIFLFSLTLISIAAINISKYIEVYIADLGYGAKGIGDFVFVTGIVGILTTLLIVPIVIKLKRNFTVMLMINVLSAFLIFLTFRIENVMLALYTIFMLYVILKNIYAPFETSYIAGFAQEGEHSKMMGIRQFFFAIGFVIGPLIGGFIYEINPLLVFDLSVVLFILGFVLLIIINKRIKKEMKLNKNL